LLTFLSTRYFRALIAILVSIAVSMASFSCGKPLIQSVSNSQSFDIKDLKPDSLVLESVQVDTLAVDSSYVLPREAQLAEIIKQDSTNTILFDIEASKQDVLVEKREFVIDTISAASVIMQQKTELLDEMTEIESNDSLDLKIIEINPDSLIDEGVYQSDTLVMDSVFSPQQESQLDEIVEYNSGDSLRFDIKNHKVYLFKSGVIDYGNINLVGDYMEIDFNTNELFSKGVEDEDGKIIGTPVFKEDERSFESKQLRYNFDTKKGLIFGMKTEEGEGFILGEKIKKMPDDIIYLDGGQYTTCDLPEPHFSFRFKKSKIIPGGMIITGPVNFQIEGVPTPLVLPFGLFPGKSGQTSGILMPTYGSSTNQGYYLMNGGYYWALSDYFDLSLRGSIYTRGSWSLNPNFRYTKKYQYSGSFDFKYAINILGTEGSPDYSRTRDFRIQWSHNQDAKARPNSKFSGNVNIVTSSFNQYETQNTFENKLSNTFQSSINYSTNFNKKWFLNVNLGHRQNTLNKTFELTLPELSLTGTQIYPFRKKGKVGNLKWYDNISLKYSMTARNSALMPDSVFLQPEMQNYFKNGIKHTIPISSTIKLLKYLTWTNSASYTERWYSQTVQKYYEIESIDDNGNVSGSVNIDTIGGFKAARDYSLSSSINTRIYGMYRFGDNSPIRAIRHVLTPSVSFSYRPDFGEDKYGYYEEYYDEARERFVQYSIFEGAIYGGPSRGESGSLNLNVTNNFEMKVRDRNDTLTGTRKVVLIDNLTLSTNYNIAKDSLRWAPLILSARTKLFKNLDLRYSSAFDPYILDSAGTSNLNQFEWTVNKRILRLKNASWNLGINLSLKNDSFKKKDKTLDGDNNKGAKTGSKDAAQQPIMPWSININYTFQYISNHSYLNYVLDKDQKIVQTLGFNGNIQLTPNWKVSVRSGYDFQNKQISYTSLDVYRDMHCWEMRFNWIPLGTWKSWNFGINIKASVLKDLKYEKKKSHLEN
jgi:lipopolysaccharide assembly outer membrane protein LptD (OstA)